MDRFLLFFPEAVVLTVVAGVAYVCTYLLNQYYKQKTFMWGVFHFRTIYWTTTGVKLCLINGTIEEVLFRLPLIVGFTALSMHAWVAVIISSLLFAICHWNVFPELTLGQKLRYLIKVFAFGVIVATFGIYYQSLLLCAYIHIGTNLWWIAIAWDKRLVELWSILWQRTLRHITPSASR